MVYETTNKKRGLTSAANAWKGLGLMRWFATALLLVVMGCAQPADDPTIELTLNELGFPVPEHTIDEGIWRELPASCDGFADHADLETAYAENAPSLGVLMLGGEPVCVDTWAGIQIELERVLGDPSPDPMHPLMQQIELPSE